MQRLTRVLAFMSETMTTTRSRRMPMIAVDHSSGGRLKSEVLRTGTIVAALSAALLLLGFSGATYASDAIYVGKNLTKDGGVLLAGFGDEPSSHWLSLIPRRQYPAGATISVGGTAAASLPGELIDIPQVGETFRYLSMDYSFFLGLTAPLTNGGMNENGVAVRDVALFSRQELVDMTPKPQHGVNYSDIARIVLERAKTAREAVEIAVSLIERYGYFTYGGNSHVFADPNEGWVLLEFAGGRGLWVARRLGLVHKV
jgi:dipeptidase